MNIFITVGTYEFLQKLAAKYPQENLITMVNEDGTLLLHETEGSTVFKQPRRYEVLDSAGELKKEGFVVMNHIPVTDEGRPLFEHQFKNRTGKIENQPGFKALRVLRPVTSNTYVILTVWKNETSFQNWKNSNSFAEAHQNGAKKGVSSQPDIFTANPYVTKYTIIDLE